MYIFAILAALGNVERMKIRTDCCGNTFPREVVGQDILRATSIKLLRSSIVVQEKHWHSKHQHIDSAQCCRDQLNPSFLKVEFSRNVYEGDSNEEIKIDGQSCISILSIPRGANSSGY